MGLLKYSIFTAEVAPRSSGLSSHLISSVFSCTSTCHKPSTEFVALILSLCPSWNANLVQHVKTWTWNLNLKSEPWTETWNLKCLVRYWRDEVVKPACRPKNLCIDSHTIVYVLEFGGEGSLNTMAATQQYVQKKNQLSLKSGVLTIWHKMTFSISQFTFEFICHRWMIAAMHFQ